MLVAQGVTLVGTGVTAGVIGENKVVLGWGGGGGPIQQDWAQLEVYVKKCQNYALTSQTRCRAPAL